MSLPAKPGSIMNRQLSRGACFGVVIAIIFIFTLIAGMFSSRAANFLGTYIAYLLFQLIFFYIFRAVYKNKERSWVVLIAFIGFALIPTLLGVATQDLASPATMLAPMSAFAIFIAGWWIFCAARKNLVTATTMPATEK